MFPVKAALLSAAFLFLAACSSLLAVDGRRFLDADLTGNGFVSADQGSRSQRLRALLRHSARSDVLTVYIEGDGAPWPTLYHPPADPTPTTPIVAAMALADSAGSVAYLGRPCQYLESNELSQCSPKLWTSNRFAPEVAAQMDGAVTDLMHQAGATRLRLVGYSGGGVIATLLAARRQDVERLITVAAPLRVGAWVRHHKVSPLTGSLDPDEVDLRLPNAVHFVGLRDKVVPSAIVAPFAEKTGGRLIVVPGFDHRCCWSREWRKLLEEI